MIAHPKISKNEVVYVHLNPPEKLPIIEILQEGKGLNFPEIKTQKLIFRLLDLEPEPSLDLKKNYPHFNRHNRHRRPMSKQPKFDAPEYKKKSNKTTGSFGQKTPKTADPRTTKTGINSKLPLHFIKPF